MSRSRNSQRTIESILDISSKLFREKGYEQTTIEDIVAEMGATRGSFYHHFKSKEDVLYALSEQKNYESVFAEIKSIKGLSGLEKLRKLIIYSLDASFSKKNAHLTQGLLSLLENPRILVEHIKELQNEMLSLVMPFVEEGMKDGSIKDGDAKVITEFILLLFSFWLMPTIYPGDKTYVEKKVLVIKTALDALGCEILDNNLLGYIVTISDFSK